MKKLAFLMLAVIILIISTSFSVFATGFETQDIPRDEELRVGNRISFSKYNTKKVPFSNFDVNDKGLIALVSTSGSINPRVLVYDQNGKFQYQYIVDTLGIIYAEWEGDNLWIYIVRGNHAVLVDTEGNVVQVEEIADTKANTSYGYEVRAKKKAVGNESYAAKTGLGPLGLMANEYAQIVVTRADGEQEILYNVTSALLKKALLATLLAVLLIIVVVFFFVIIAKSSTRYQNKKRYGSPYKPNAKITFIDRILDALEKKQQQPKDDEEDNW